MKPNKQQQKMLNKLEEIGELEDVIVRGDVVLRLADMRLRIEETGRVRYFERRGNSLPPVDQMDNNHNSKRDPNGERCHRTRRCGQTPCLDSKASRPSLRRRSSVFAPLPRP
jgi:hypothetical protein